MASNINSQATGVNLDTPVTVLVTLAGDHQRLRFPLRDVSPDVFLKNLRAALEIPEGRPVVFERYSDRYGAFVVLDPEKPGVFKQLFRAAKVKLKLRIHASYPPDYIAGSGSTLVDANTSVAPSTIDNATTPTAIVTPVEPMHPSMSQQEDSEKAALPVSSDDSQIVPAMSQTASNDHAETENAGTAVPETLDSSSDHRSSATMAEPSSTAEHVTADSDNRPQEPSAVDSVPAPAPAPANHDFMSRIMQTRAFSMALLNDRALGSHGFGMAPSSFMVYCNACDRPIVDPYYHCNVCDDGDFDLCCYCVNVGRRRGCHDHTLEMRVVHGGQVVTLPAERLVPRKSAATVQTGAHVVEPAAAPGTEAYLSTSSEVEKAPLRRCNDCLTEHDENKFVVCSTCPSYALCFSCFVRMRHGHASTHQFRAADSSTILNPVVKALCEPGRNMHHLAICDGCDKNIVGVRHKCLDCPDWDYCATCIQSAPFIHPEHRFVALSEKLAFRPPSKVVHIGKLCDGPLCKHKPRQGYIRGDLYKCAVCHDTDFCANCEASPTNLHDKTHPLIKLKTPVNGVSICTLDERADMAEVPILGDRHARSDLMATAAAWLNTTPPAASSNAATQVQTVVDVKPSSTESAQPMESKSAPPEQPAKDELNAHFVSDTIKDGTVLLPNCVFTQLWTLVNPGPAAWPKGSSVKFVGGDNMRNIDMGHPISVADLEKSVESNRLPVDVEVGSSWQFSVSMKTPRNRGKYISYWRLTAPDGRKFGHKLWCEVDVRPDTNAVSSEAAAPTPSDASESKDLSTSSTSQTAADAPAAEEPAAKETVDSGILSSKESVKVEVDSSLPLRSKLGHDRRHFWMDEDRPQIEHIEDVSKEHAEESDLEKSSLIFPTLEKEMPASEVAPAEETVASADEAEEVTAENEDESDDEFLTDEEYDILDASDA